MGPDTYLALRILKISIVVGGLKDDGYADWVERDGVVGRCDRFEGLVWEGCGRLGLVERLLRKGWNGAGTKVVLEYVLGLLDEDN